MRVRTAYRVHRKLLANRSSCNLYVRSQPALTPLQERLVEELKTDGVAAAKFEDLVPDDGLWEELCADIEAFARAGAARLPADRVGPAKKSDFLARRYNTRENRARSSGRWHRPGPWAAFPASDPWVRLGVRPEILDVVNTYRGLWTRYVEFDHWYTVPFSDPHDRVSTQNWHRDKGDQGLVTLFLYFSDVDEGAGPFQYVRGSARGGPFGQLWPWTPFGEKFAAGEDVLRRIPATEWKTMTGPSGTMILADTSGLHRGGFARVSPRILSYHVYVSPAATRSSLRNRTFAVEALPAGAETSDAARFALT
jgi:hypothetical protein